MNKTAVITGAAGVLCSCFAEHLAKKGYRVALIDINKESCERVAKKIQQEGNCAKAYVCSVLDKQELEEVRKKISSDLGSCDILINGAGGNNPLCTTVGEEYKKGDEGRTDEINFFNIDKGGFDFVFDLNLKGVLIPSQVFMKDMVAKKGCCVINISSMNAYRPLTKIPAYSAAKAAVSNFTSWLAVHFAKQGIRVNAIAPGFFVTAQNKNLLFDSQGLPTKRTEKILNATPMGRFGEAEELVGTLEWLIDEEKSGFVTGITVPVDGGFSAYSGV